MSAYHVVVVATFLCLLLAVWLGAAEGLGAGKKQIAGSTSTLAMATKASVTDTDRATDTHPDDPDSDSDMLTIYMDPSSETVESVTSRLIKLRLEDGNRFVEYILKRNEQLAGTRSLQEDVEKNLILGLDPLQLRRRQEQSPDIFGMGPENEQNRRVLKGGWYCLIGILCGDDFEWVTAPCVIKITHHPTITWFGAKDTSKIVGVCPPTQFPTAYPIPDPTPVPISNPTPLPISQPTNHPTPLPIANPTFQPTLMPIANPTPFPIPNPSRAPVPNPTLQPTFMPSQQPSLPPSAIPTFMPSYMPSAFPIASPTLLPIAQPTLAPTFRPSQTPTALPSWAPTTNPSLTPTAVPTLTPSGNPTLQPTAVPTLQPSALPTILPSANPTMRTDVPIPPPTARPTAPSPDPTSLPTFSPSTQPTVRPSAAPTPLPTAQPSVIPTMLPTAAPSTLPSPLPTTPPSPSPSPEPSSEPTTLPSPLPSSLPTSLPSPMPSSAPTLDPSAIPTPEPSALPTPLPTRNPSPLPTLKPTSRPSPAPSTVPTAKPSALPTETPSTPPTLVPSPAPSFFPTGSPTAPPSTQPTTRPTTLPSLAPTAAPTVKKQLSVSTPGTQTLSSLTAITSSPRDSIFLYAGIAGGVLSCCIVAGYLKYRANMKKRRSPYEQWVDYKNAQLEGRKYRADTIVREPVAPAALPGGKKVDRRDIEMNDMIPLPALRMEHDFRQQGPTTNDTATSTASSGGGTKEPRALGSISQFEVTDFYRNSVQKDEAGRRELRGVAEGNEDDDGDQGDDFYVNPIPAAKQAPAAQTNPRVKSASVFGIVNPLVSGGQSQQSPRIAGGGNINVNVGLLGADVNNPLNFDRASKRINPALANLSTPVQSPQSLAAARASAERFDQHNFEDDEEDEGEEEEVEGGDFTGYDDEASFQDAREP